MSSSSATTAADRRTVVAAIGAVTLALVVACLRPEGGPPGGAPAPIPAAPGPAAPTGADPEPSIRIGVVVNSASVPLGGAVALRLTAADGSWLGDVPAGGAARVVPAGAGVSVRGASAPASGDRIVVRAAQDGGYVRVNGREYRGDLVLLRHRDGVTVVNHVPLEAYLESVVSSEMGRRAPDEAEALRAQAVISRTYALRNLGRWRPLGFDLYGTVADQVYGGVARETPLGTEAVRATRGQVLVYQGELIDAFFFSTCGGHTAEGTEIFREARRPYLRSIADEDESGRAYCSISPRYRWQQVWTGTELRATLARNWPETGSQVPVESVQGIRDVRVTGRTGSGRVAALAIALRAREIVVDGPSVRRVLRPPNGDLLWSNAFTLTATNAGGHVARLVADGAGAGHAVGLCQWGAVGRARAGHSYPQILAAYYGGSELERRY